MSGLIPEWQRAPVLEAVFDQISDALVLYDRDMIITGVNRAAEKLFGISSDEMIGKSCRDVFRCGVCEPGCGMLVGLNQGPSVPNGTVRLHTDNGRERLALMHTSHLYDAGGELQGVVATITDITEETETR